MPVTALTMSHSATSTLFLSTSATSLGSLLQFLTALPEKKFLLSLVIQSCSNSLHSARPQCQCKDKLYSWSNLTQPHAAEPPGDLICPPPWSAGCTLNQQMSSLSIHVFEDAFQNRECVNPLIWKPGLLKNLLLWQFRRSCCRWDRWNVLINFLPSYVWILSFLYAESVHSSLLVFWGPEQCASAVKEVPW